MGMLKMIKAGWQSLTPVEKVKEVVKLICCAGMGTICGDIANEHMVGKTKLEKAGVMVASWGLGTYLGNKAGEAAGEVIDAAAALNDIRKASKKEEHKEENANG